MVYRLARPERKSMGWFLKHVVVHQSIVLSICFAVLWLFIPFEWYFYVAVFLVAILVICCQNWASLRRIERRFEVLGTQFVTMTEAGVMVESDDSGTKNFTPWERISKVWLRSDMLMLRQTNGLFQLLPTASLRREQADSMLAYATAHAGKKGATPIAPPAALLTGKPARVTAAPTQWREFVRFVMREALPGRMLLSYVAVVALSCAFSLSVVHEIPFLPLEILVALVVALVIFINPGLFARAMRKNPSPGYLHVSRDTVLVLSDSGAWSVIPTGMFDSALRLRHSIIYRTRVLCCVLADVTPEPLPHLPRPCKPRRRLLLTVLAVLLIFWPLFDFFPDEYEEALERGEQLQMYMEELLPPQEYPGRISYCAYYADDAVVGIEWENGLDVFLYCAPEEGQSEDCPGEEE